MGVFYVLGQTVLLSTVLFFLIAYSPTFLNVDPQPFSTVETGIRKFTGPLSQNERLSNVKKLFEGEILAPESFSLIKGKIYTGLDDGRIISFDDKKSYQNVTVPQNKCDGPWDHHLCGRPLGIRATSDGKYIYAADPYKGLLKVDVKTGESSVIVTAGTVIDGKPMKLMDDIYIDEKRQSMYFSDASAKYTLANIMYSVIELLPTGRILKMDMKTNEISTLFEGFLFTNGVQMTHDEKALLICDSYKRTIYRYHLEGPDAGKLDVFVSELPGFPDNIRPSRRGGYWIAMCEASNPEEGSLLENIQKLPPIVRKVLLRVMDRISASINFVSHHLISSHKWKSLAFMLSSHSYMYNVLSSYGLIIEVDGEGNIIDSLHAPNGQIKFISEVLELENGDLYLGSFLNNFVGFVEANKSNK